MFTKYNLIFCVVIEKAPRQEPPVFQYPTLPGQSTLRRFTGISGQSLMILGARRVPAVYCPISNTNEAISILTSVGFSELSLDDYIEATNKLRPDIMVALADIPFGHEPGVKRLSKMGDRTIGWLRDTIEQRPECATFA